MSTHARLSPSAAHRWLKCTAAPTMEAQYPESSSSYAQEGTDAHSLAELSTKLALGMISDQEYDASFDLFTGSSDYFNQEMDDAAELYANYIKEKLYEFQKTCPDAFAELEVSLDLSEFIPEGFGTADCVIIAEPKMQIIDFKYGKGVAVEAEGNPQMEIYALGALARYSALYDIKEIGMTIVQPRLGGISETSMDVEQLRAWANVGIIPKAKEAFEGPGEFRPGDDTCKFCKAKHDCKARADHFLRVFDENPLEGILTAEEAGEILKRADGMKAWLDDLEAKVVSSLFAGEPVPGWKLVAGKSNRKYADEEKVAEVLKKKGRLKASEIYTKKLNTITNLEKILGKKKFADLLGDLIIKPEGKPTLAPASDKRPEIHPAEQIVSAFDE